MYLNCVIICCKRCAGLFIVVDVVWREVVRTLISRGNSDDSTCWHCMCMRSSHRGSILYAVPLEVCISPLDMFAHWVGSVGVWYLMCCAMCSQFWIRENFVSSLLATCYHAAWVVLCFRRAGCVRVQRMDNIVAVVWTTPFFCFVKIYCSNSVCCVV